MLLIVAPLHRIKRIRNRTFTDRGQTMLYFGEFWTKHITREAQQEIWQWYGSLGYPPHLRRELMHPPIINDRGDGQAFDPRAYQHILRQVKDYACNSVARYNLAYHNNNHFAEVAHAATSLFDAVHGSAARRPGLLAVRQALEIAAWLHDCHHRGSTLRVDAVHPLPLPHLGKNVSVEFVSAAMADDFLNGIGLPLSWRVFIANCILATSFGGGEAKKRGISGVPVVAGHTTLYHTLIHVADIWPPQDVFAASRQGVAVNLHETPATGQKILEPAALMKAQLGFEHYRSGEMRRLDAVCGKTVTGNGRARCAKNATLYESALAGKHAKLATYVATLMR